MPDKFNKIHALLNERKQHALLRQLTAHDGAQDTNIYIAGQSYLAFNSNDYLGLANHPKIKEAAKTAIDHIGVGSGSAHLVSGHHKEHHLLEEQLAEFTGRDKALLFSTGYMANIGILNAMLDNQDGLFMDKWNHASLIDGALLSNAKFHRYKHNDMSHLQSLVDKYNYQQSVIAADAVFSMDGDCADANTLVKISQKNNYWLMLDDAHGFGCLGDKGAGFSESYNQQQLPIYMATLGKAIGVSGAFVAGDEALIDYLTQTARSFIYTTALPPALAAATRQAISLLQEESWRRDQLNENINYFKQCANDIDLELMSSDTAIQPVLIGESEQASLVSKKLKEAGILISAIRPPTVPAGSARLRITLSASHTNDEIDRLISVLSEIDFNKTSN